MWLGPFKLAESIAEGGMSEVFRGRMPGEDAEIALKVMTSRLATRSFYREQFRREVQAMARLNHPAIATVYDLGEVASGEAHASEGQLPEGAPWLAMEYVDGESLGEYLEAPDWPRVEAVILELFDALAHAHADGVIHRDLKPSNVLVSRGERGEPAIKLVDFGIARILGAEGDDDTGASPDEHVPGTPEYMAPEQILGNRRSQGPWTDLYAVGCLVWRLLCGSAPFEGDDSQRVLAGHVDGELPDFEPPVAVPAELETWLEKLLAKKPTDRFRRAADAAYALMTIARGDSLEGSPEKPIEQTTDSPTARTTLAALEEGLWERVAGGNDPTESAEAVAQEVRREWPPPPVPVHWRRQFPEQLRIPLRGAGTNLFGLRKIPVVDREEERDRMWQTLRQSVDSSQARGLVISGSPGCGKSRLAGWLARRAHETGAANLFRVLCSPSQGRGPSEGLGPMLVRYFRTYGLDFEETRERIEGRLARLGRPSAPLRHDIPALARLMARAGGEEPARDEPFDTPAARNRAFGRLFRHLGEERLSVLVFDDVQWASESLELIDFLLNETDEPVPVLAVVTLGWETTSMPAENRALIDEITGSAASTEVGLEPLAREHQIQLARQLLGLDTDLAGEVADRTGGNPLFAIQLVGDWIERGLLVRSTGGFELRESGEASVPEDIADLWELRLERLFAALDDEVAEASQMRLEIAAVLGESVDRKEWSEACRLRGIEVEEPSPMLDAMFRRGLAERNREGWSFAHEMLRRRVLDVAGRGDRLVAHHDVCARALEEVYGAQALGIPLRIARHRLAARESAEAIPYLDRAIWQCLDTGDYERAEMLVERHDDIARRVGGEEGRRAQMRNRVLRGTLMVGTGRGEEGRELIEPVVEEARQRGWDYELASALLVRVRVLKDAGESDQAHRDCLRALGHLDWEAHPIATGQLYRAMGSIERDRGDAERARRSFEKAAEWFEEGGFYSHQAAQLSSVGYTWLLEGEYRRASEAFHRALERARRSGNRAVEAEAWNRLGELAREESNWERARECYESAIEIHRSISERNTHIPTANLALAELGAGNWSKAREILTPLVDKLSQAGFDVWNPGLRLAIACADAAEGDYDAAIERARRVHSQLEESKAANPDTAWLGEMLGRHCREEDRECARIGWSVARDQWRQLGRDEKARACQRRLEEAEPGADPSGQS